MAVDNEELMMELQRVATLMRRSRRASVKNRMKIRAAKRSIARAIPADMMVIVAIVMLWLRAMNVLMGMAITNAMVAQGVMAKTVFLRCL